MKKYKGVAAGLDKLCRRFEEAREKHVTAAHDPGGAKKIVAGADASYAPDNDDHSLAWVYVRL